MGLLDFIILNGLIGNNNKSTSTGSGDIGWGGILFISSPFLWLYRHEILICLFISTVGFLCWAVINERRNWLQLIVTIGVVGILGWLMWLSWDHISGEWADYLRECSVVRPGNQL